MVLRALFLFSCLFALQSGSCARIADTDHLFSSKEKAALENRLEKIGTNHDIGIYVFPYQLVQEEAPVTEIHQAVLNGIKDLTDDINTVKTHNYIYYGREQKGNGWNLWFMPLTLQINGEERQPELKEKVDLIYSKAGKLFVNDRGLSVQKTLYNNIAFIEHALSPFSFLPFFHFSFELSGLPLLSLFALSIISWLWMKRLFLPPIIGFVQGVCVSFLTSGSFNGSVILNHIVMGALITLLFFMVESVRTHLRLRPKLARKGAK